MNRLHTVVVPIALLMLLFSSCKDGGDSVDNRPAGLHATIVNQSGGAIAGVDVHYIFYSTTNPVALNVTIQYSLATPQVVTLKVFDPFDREVSTPINAAQQPAGQHSRLVSDSSFTNAVYSYRLQTGNSLSVGSFYIRDDDISRLQQKTPLTVSDQRGQFFLSPVVLGIGRTFPGQFSNETITDSIAVVLVKANHVTLVQSFRLDAAKPTERIFTMQSN